MLLIKSSLDIRPNNFRLLENIINSFRFADVLSADINPETLHAFVEYDNKLSLSFSARNILGYENILENLCISGDNVVIFYDGDEFIKCWNINLRRYVRMNYFMDTPKSWFSSCSVVENASIEWIDMKILMAIKLSGEFRLG